ncbi:MAG TPA: translocation/assembly module TamB domain-containing protein, partial [Rubrivivax sp.]|nr:translocation/assembly module TamB domain-containing protein [Rubrivivax sp.]
GWRVGGQLQAVASVAGTVGDPQASGRITGSDLVVRNLFEGVHLRNGELAVALRGSEAVIERLVFQGSEGGTLRGTGRATLAGAEPRAVLNLQADRFRALDRVDRRVTISGGADLTLQDKQIKVGGSFRVDQGLIDVTQANAPKNDAEVIVVNRPGTQVAPKGQPGVLAQAQVQVTVDLGENLRLRGGGLDTLLRGQLRVSTRKDGELHVAGVIRTVDGTYSAYGQNLAIERGELTFTGDVANPRLDVLAVRPDLDTQRVGVAVTGLAVNPRVRLYSEPDLPEFETLAWLVLGREPGGLGRDDTALLQRAALALLAGDRGGGPGQGLVQRLGLDQLSFSAGSGGNLSEGIVSLGKQISKRLYVGYEHALAGAGGTWQLVYRVAGRFTVRLQAGDDQTLDAIWTWRWE